MFTGVHGFRYDYLCKAEKNFIGGRTWIDLSTSYHDYTVCKRGERKVRTDTASTMNS